MQTDSGKPNSENLAHSHHVLTRHILFITMMNARLDQIEKASLLYVGDSCLVIGIDAARSLDGKDSVAVRDVVLKIKLGSVKKLQQRAELDLATRHIPHVLPILCATIKTGGQRLLAMFASEAAYNGFTDSLGLNAKSTMHVIRKMSSSPVYMSWCQRMDGDVDDLPASERRTLADTLTYLFTAVLRDGSADKTGKFIDHGALSGKNVLYKVNAHDGSKTFVLSDFARSSFTDDPDEVDRDIAVAVQRITTGTAPTKNMACVVDERLQRRVTKRGVAGQ